MTNRQQAWQKFLATMSALKKKQLEVFTLISRKLDLQKIEKVKKQIKNL